MPMKDVEKVGEALRLRRTRYWFKPSDFRSWVRSTKPVVGTIPAHQAEKAKQMMLGDRAAVIEKMATVGNKLGSTKEVPWAMMAKFVGFMWDHNFEFKYLAWIVKQYFQV